GTHLKTRHIDKIIITCHSRKEIDISLKRETLPRKSMFTAHEATKLKKEVKHLVKVNKMTTNWDDDATIGTAFGPTTSTGAVKGLNMEIGLAVDPTDGTEAYCLDKKMDMTLWLSNVNPTGIDANVRIILFRDTANLQAEPAVTDVLQVDNIFSPYDYVNLNRFRIIYDKIHHLQPNVNQASGANSVCSKFIRIHKKFKDVKMSYVGNSGTVTDCQKNQLFILCITDTPGSSGVNVSGYSRRHFEEAKLKN
ncbi:MAG TPA: hypothetical protein VMR41_03955, partial [Patescibacteria group bacterium]|nr:hypothetical protein [Patescibacteria group bacterium]